MVAAIRAVTVKREAVSTVLGFMAAPIVPGALFAILTPATSNADVVSVVSLLAVGYFFSAMAVLVFGVPSFFLFRHLGLVRWWSALASGCVGGGLVGFIVKLPNGAEPHEILRMGAAGGIAGIVFFLVTWKSTERGGHSVR